MNTESFLQNHFSDRIGYRGDLTLVLKKICEYFDLGDLIKFSKLDLGYQDFNIVIETARDKFFVKIFSKAHSTKNCEDYISLMDKIYSAGISYPKLIKQGNNSLCAFKINNVDIRACVQEYISGENLALLNYEPNFDEVKEISRQASAINSIECVYDYHERDTWATRNFLEQYPVKRKALDEYENSLVEPLIEKFTELNISKLPKSFVHGDIIHTNVMKDARGKIWIIDFGVAKNQPRIIELAVLFHDLFIDLNSRDKTFRKREIALKEYQKKIQLSQMELDALPLLINVTHAMYLMSSAYMERIIQEHTEETSYWLKRSKESLIESLK